VKTTYLEKVLTEYGVPTQREYWKASYTRWVDAGCPIQTRHHQVGESLLRILQLRVLQYQLKKKSREYRAVRSLASMLGAHMRWNAAHCKILAHEGELERVERCLREYCLPKY
jgi:hypothetical protein